MLLPIFFITHAMTHLHLETKHYARILGRWVDEWGLDRANHGTHSMLWAL
jgi:hypothetical protein